MQMILNVIFLLWMFVALALWFLMWRESVKRTTRTTQALIDMGNKGADAAKAAADAAQKAVALLEKRLHA